MKPKWDVRVLGFETLSRIERHWSSADFTALLEAMDYGDTSSIDDAELRDMVILSLQDRSPVEAAAMLMQHRLGKRLKKGQIETLAHDLAEENEKLWEHYADMSLHEDLFAVGSLASEAFPTTFPVPDAAQLKLRVSPTNKAAHEAIKSGIREPLLARLVGSGMADNAILHRLFSDQLAASHFPEAEAILWTIDVTPDGDAVNVEIMSAGIWLDPLADVDHFTCTAWPDA